MKLIILDFDKTLIRLDSGLVTSVLCFQREPLLLLRYVMSAFFKSKSFQISMKKAVERCFDAKRQMFWLKKLKRKKVSKMLELATKKNISVIILSGSSSKIIKGYLHAWGMHQLPIIIIGRETLPEGLTLIDQKVEALSRVKKGREYSSVIHLNDNKNELKHLPASKKILIRTCRNLFK
jgi:phosphoglycolate phosphatase-like HAD superfamily hydrolase